MANHAYIHVSGLLARRIAYILCLATCIDASAANLVFAAVEDSRFEFSPDGTNVVFEVRDAPRREVLKQLFAATDIEIKWLNASFADEPISGTFRGDRAVVARLLLSRTNFVIGYDDKARLARIVIVGPAAGEPNASALAALTAAIQLNGGRGSELPKAMPLDSGRAVAPVTPGAATARPMPTAGPPAVAIPLPSTAFPVPDKTTGSPAAPTAPISAPFTPAAPTGSAGR